MKIEVLKIGGEWKVEFSFNNQFFVVDYNCETKAEAQWMARMLKKCFKSYEISLRK